MSATKARHLLLGPYDILVGGEEREEGGGAVPVSRVPEQGWIPAWEKKSVLQHKIKAGHPHSPPCVGRWLGPSAFPPEARAGRWDQHWTWCSGIEPASHSVSLGSCQSPGGGSCSPPGPQPGVPVLPAPHLRLLPGLALALVACLFAPLTCLFLFSSS